MTETTRLHSLAIAAAQRGDRLEALQLCDQVLDQDPDDPRALASWVLWGGAHDVVRWRVGRLAGQLALGRLDHWEWYPASRLAYAFGRICEAEGKIDQAARAYDFGGRIRARRYPYDAAEMERFVAASLAWEPYQGMPVDANLGPVWVCGMPRSGTTLLTRCLLAHPRFTGGAEYGLFEQVMAEIPHEGGVASIEDCLRAGIRYASQLGEAAALPAARVIDKTPSLVWHVGPGAAMVPGLRPIVCRRDPVEALLSAWREPFRFGCGWAGSILEAAHFASSTAEVLAGWRRRLELPLMVVELDELRRRPERVLTQVLRFLGEGWDPAVRHPERVPGDVATASLLQVRQPIRPAERSWSSVFPDRAIALQEAIR